jgi:hypothetical protein
VLRKIRWDDPKKPSYSYDLVSVGYIPEMDQVTYLSFSASAARHRKERVEKEFKDFNGDSAFNSTQEIE